ncbi:MAG TPA: hypothetical protein VEU62_23125 [Bryobacterales bacterium]|nr:hypothetical protein [Bryobacterales bacterium]
MGSPRFPFSIFLILLAIGTLAAPPAAAAGGRDFAALYQLSHVTDLGVQVRVTLALRLFNYSDADLSNAKVTLQDSREPLKSLGSLGTISFRRHESGHLSETFIIPKEEYNRWHHGASPTVQITYKDGHGKPQQRLIELAPRFVGGGF